MEAFQNKLTQTQIRTCKILTESALTPSLCPVFDILFLCVGLFFLDSMIYFTSLKHVRGKQASYIVTVFVKLWLGGLGSHPGSDPWYPCLRSYVFFFN